MFKKFGKKRYYAGGTYAPAGSYIGQGLQAAGGIASMIPGVGTLFGAGLNIAGSIITANAKPNNPAEIVNTLNSTANLSNSAGLAYGGKIRRALGGELEALSEDAIQVNADNPMMTDSVETPDSFLDHGEVVTGDKVFSNKIVNPSTNRTFAEDEEINQKILGKFQRLKNKSGDNEYQDEKFIKQNSEALFENQEKLASALGLREQDGTPKQSFAWGGRKKKYYTGGPYPGDLNNPGNGDLPIGLGESMFPDLTIKDNIFKNPLQPIVDGTLPRIFDKENYTRNIKFKTSNETPVGEDYYPPMPTFDESYNPDTSLPFLPNTNTDQAIDLSNNATGNLLPQTSPDTGSRLNPVRVPTYNINEDRIRYNELKPVVDFKGFPTDSEEFTATPLDIPGLTRPLDTTADTPTTEDGSTSLKELLGTPFKDHPYGTAGTYSGVASQVAGMLSNRPSYVGYRNVGAQEINQQEQALKRMQAGEGLAINAGRLKTNAFKRSLNERGVQARNALMRNLAAGETQTEGETRAKFAEREANLRSAIGQRRTGIESVNLQKNMQTDVINTQEIDAVKTENMKMADNIRKMLIELQLSSNASKTNKILQGLASTKNFKFDLNDPDNFIKFVSTLTK